MATAWESRFTNHSLWTLVNQIAESLDGVAIPGDTDGAGEVLRIRLVIEALHAHREEDSAKYTGAMLDRVYSILSQNIAAWVQQYKDDPDAYAASLRSAADAMDNVIDNMVYLPALTPKGMAQAAGKAAKAYETASVQALADLNNEVKRLHDLVAKLETTLTAHETRMTVEQKTFIDESRDELHGEFMKAVSDFEQASATSLTDSEKALSSARSIVTQLESLHEQSGKIAGAVARRAVAHDYQRNARNKAVGGWIWDMIGTLIGAAALGALLYHLLTAKGETSLPLATTRLAVSVGGLGLAALCFRRGSGNHAESRRAKRADIRLSTVNAFVANLDPDVQAAVIEGMAERIYIDGELDVPDKDDTGHKTLEERVVAYRARKAAQAADTGQTSP